MRYFRLLIFPFSIVRFTDILIKNEEEGKIILVDEYNGMMTYKVIKNSDSLSLQFLKDESFYL